jgi:hypothetical protein
VAGEDPIPRTFMAVFSRFFGRKGIMGKFFLLTTFFLIDSRARAGAEKGVFGALKCISIP